MKDPTVDQFSAIVGIDWADQKHDVHEYDVRRAEVVSRAVISSKPEAVHEWACSLRQRYPDKPVAVACELKKGPLIFALMKYDHIVIFPLHPKSVAKYREAFASSGAKNDPADAELQAEMLRMHMHRYAPILPDSAEVRALAQFVECRRKLVQDRVDLTNSLTHYLKNYYPQALEWFGEKDSTLFADFIIRWPSLMQVKRARKSTLTDFMHQHNVRYPKTIESRIKAIRDATALTDDEGVIAPNQFMAEQLALQLKTILASIASIEKEIADRYRPMADREIFDSFPAAGAQFAPRLLSAFGSNRDRYQDASEVQMYAGIAPVVKASGKSSWTHWRYACPKFLRRVACKSTQRKKLERLCRYITRPAIAEQRLSLASNGNVIVGLKTPYDDGTTHVVLSPLEFIGRLAALVPTPRVNLTRFHGVFSPNSKLREYVVPQKPTEPEERPKPKAYSMTWAQRLKRVFAIDIEKCEKCGGPVRVIASIEDPDVVERILKHLGLDQASQPHNRSPPETLFEHSSNLF